MYEQAQTPGPTEPVKGLHENPVTHAELIIPEDGRQVDHRKSNQRRQRRDKGVEEPARKGDGLPETFCRSFQELPFPDGDLASRAIVLRNGNLKSMEVTLRGNAG